jgi:hypothetical protein
MSTWGPLFGEGSSRLESRRMHRLRVATSMHSWHDPLHNHLVRRTWEHPWVRWDYHYQPQRHYAEAKP